MFCVRLIDRLSLTAYRLWPMAVLVVLTGKRKLQIHEKKSMSGKAMFFGYLRLGRIASAILKPAASGKCLVSSD